MADSNTTSVLDSILGNMDKIGYATATVISSTKGGSIMPPAGASGAEPQLYTPEAKQTGTIMIIGGIALLAVITFFIFKPKK